MVPKANGDLRLIFDLSHGGEQSINGCTPRELCVMTYKPFEYAVRMVLRAQEQLDSFSVDARRKLFPYMAKSDLKSAFRLFEAILFTKLRKVSPPMHR